MKTLNEFLNEQLQDPEVNYPFSKANGLPAS